MPAPDGQPCAASAREPRLRSPNPRASVPPCVLRLVSVLAVRRRTHQGRGRCSFFIPIPQTAASTATVPSGGNPRRARARDRHLGQLEHGPVQRQPPFPSVRSGRWATGLRFVWFPRRWVRSDCSSQIARARQPGGAIGCCFAGSFGRAAGFVRIPPAGLRFADGPSRWVRLLCSLRLDLAARVHSLHGAAGLAGFV